LERALGASLEFRNFWRFKVTAMNTADRDDCTSRASSQEVGFSKSTLGEAADAKVDLESDLCPTTESTHLSSPL